MTTVTDLVGRQTQYGYEAAYQVCTSWWFNDFVGTWQCNGLKWVYRVRTATDPYGRSATYTYDANTLKMTSVTNASGRITNYGYNPTSGLLETVTNARGFVATFLWTSGPDGTPRVARVTAPDGTATNYAYTHEAVAPYRVIRTVVTNARGHASAYDVSDGNVVRATDPLGNATQYAYDARRNVTQVTDARGIATTYAYNTRNKVTQIVRAAGILNLTTTLSWDGNDNLLSVTNPRGIRTDYTYSATHNLTSVRRAVGTADESLTQYAYTAWGGVSSVTDPRGFVTSYAYTLRRQLQTVTPPAGGATTLGYDAFDDQVSMTNGNAKTWSTVYNTSRQVTSVTDPLNNRVSYEYDANGNQTRVIDAKLQATSFAYNSRDRLISITDPLNGVTGYNNDPEGNLIRITNARNFATTFAYDALNRLTQVTDALLQSTTYGYDQVGNRTSVRDRKAVLFSYSYDQVNRLVSVSGGGVTISYTYDANGNRLTMGDVNGTTSYAYDALDRHTRTTYPDTRSVSASYDKIGNRVSLTNPGGVATSASYDAASRLTALTQGTLQWTFAYNGAGNRTRMTHPNATSTDYAFLGNNWLSSITHNSPVGAIVQSFAYTYDANGNRLSQADPSGTTSFSYDALNRLLQALYPSGTWAWTYDPVGNRTSQVSPSGSISYAYDGNNRLTQAGGTAYGYDANGNLISTSTGPVPLQTFAYDAFNQLAQASGSAGTVSYTYFGDGLKRKRMGPDGTTLYYYDGIRPIHETDATGAMTAQLDRDIFGNLLSRREASGARRYFNADGLGSTTSVTDETGTVVASMLYDAWGQVRVNSGVGHGKYRFTGAELDMTSGLYHMGARFYDPAIGRWLSEDPIQTAGPSTLNFYAYVSNNPLVYTDPSGLCDQQCLGDLNARRQELAKKTNNASDYIAAREIARSLEATLGRDKAFEIAGTFLDKIANGVDPTRALEESLSEAQHPVSAGPGGSRTKEWAYRLTGGFLLILTAGAGMIVVHDLRHYGPLGILPAAGAIFAGIFTGFVGTVSLTCGSAERCERIFRQFNPFSNWP